jgi:hypothetical protein
MGYRTIFLIVVLWNCPIFGQGYIDYHRTFNQIDEDMIRRDFSSAIFRLDSIYNNYEFVYGKHCVKALQICVVAKDSIRANKWLQKCFRQGIPMWMIRANELTKISMTYLTAKQTVTTYDSFRLVYEASVDRQLSDRIDSFLTIDQKYTKKVNDGFVLFLPYYWLRWGVNNKRQIKEFKKIIELSGFPEEKKIGLPTIQDSMSFYTYFMFWGPAELRDSRMQVMLQHCYSTWHKTDFEFRDVLYKNLCEGNIPAFQYALISDFMLSGKKIYEKHLFGLSGQFSRSKNAVSVELNRSSIGLNSSEQENRNTLIERNRRKNGQSNSEIMME